MDVVDLCDDSDDEPPAALATAAAPPAPTLVAAECPPTPPRTPATPSINRPRGLVGNASLIDLCSPLAPTGELQGLSAPALTQNGSIAPVCAPRGISAPPASSSQQHLGPTGSPTSSCMLDFVRHTTECPPILSRDGPPILTREPLVAQDHPESTHANQILRPGPVVRSQAASHQMNDSDSDDSEASSQGTAVQCTAAIEAIDLVDVASEPPSPRGSGREGQEDSPESTGPGDEGMSEEDSSDDEACRRLAQVLKRSANSLTRSQSLRAKGSCVPVPLGPLKRAKTISHESHGTSGLAPAPAPRVCTADAVTRANVNEPDKPLTERQLQQLEKRKEKELARSRALEARVGASVHNGNFAKMEIRIVMEKRFYRSPNGREIAGYCLVEEIECVERDMIVEGLVWFEHRSFLAAPENPDPAAVKVLAATKKPVLDPEDPGSLMSNALLLFWDVDDFASRLSEGHERLRDKVRLAVDTWRETANSRPKSRFTKDRPKVIVVLADAAEALLRQCDLLGGMLVDEGDPVADKLSRCTASGLNFALDWLSLACGCDARLIGPTAEAHVRLFTNICGAVMSALHHIRPTALEVLALYKRRSVSRVKVALLEDEHDESDAARRDSDIKRTWVHQLQCLMSERQALRVAQVYPTFRSLMLTYRREDLSIAQKEDLLMAVLSNDKKMARLSKTVYRYMVSRDPGEVVR